MTGIAMDVRPAFTMAADVLVVGGGAAGVAAAVSAARRGLQVIMLERYGFCGGGAVAGLSGTICGLYEASDDPAAEPRQVVFGFADEFARILARRRGLTGPVRYGNTYTRVHDPHVWRESADQLLRESGVRVVYHCLVTRIKLADETTVTGVEAYTKQGGLSVTAKITIDASGDADLFAMAGFATRVGQDGRVQNPTMIFRLLGVDIDRLQQAYGSDAILPSRIVEQITKAHQGNDYYLPRAKTFLFPTPRSGELLCNATRVVGADGRELSTLNAEDLTEAEFEGRRQVREYVRFFRDHLTGCENAFLNDTGIQAGIRQSRQIVGRDILTNDAVSGSIKRKDGIAKCPWPIELHTGNKPKLLWLLNDFYEVPYGCFVPDRARNLLAAGRCLSAEHEAMASARVTAQCFSYGHAIGIAAAMCIREAAQPSDIDPLCLRNQLNHENARLD